MKLTREERRQKLSDYGRRGAETRWQQYHEENPRTYPPKLPDDCIRITVENLITSKTHVILFHQGSRKGRFVIDVDGVFWKECGFSEAMVRIRKSCKRSPLYIYD